MSNEITAPITIVRNVINAPVTLGVVSGGGGEGSSTTFSGLTDKATANIPVINTPLATALSGKQPLAAVLTGTTASFTTALANKLDGIEAGATVDQDLSGYLTISNAASTYQPLSAILTANDASFTTTIATRLANTSGTNTGDETLATIKTKLGVTTLSGTNTGDQDLSGYVPTSRTIAGQPLSSNITLVSADISDASETGTSNAIPKYSSEGALFATFINTAGGITGIDAGGAIEYSWSINASGVLTTNRALTIPNASGGIALTASTTGVPDALHNATISGTVTFSGTGQASMFAALGTGTPSSTTYLRGDGTWATVAAGGVTGTGAVDNAILRADGVGGTTLQNSDITISDASVTTQANVALVNAHSGQTNSSLVLTPKGTGAFIVGPKPDGTAVGGNARGINSIDIQISRSVAADVASGQEAVAIGSAVRASNTNTVAIGKATIASGSRSVAIGYAANSTNFESVAISGQAQATGSQSLAIGENTASGTMSVAFGNNALADRYGMASFACGFFAARGDAQRADFALRIKTTDAAATEMGLNGSTTRLTIPSGKVMSFIANITGVKFDGSAVAMYVRKGAIKNVGGTTSLVGTIEAIGPDIKDSASTDVAITADNTGDFLSIKVTGIAAETWRWVAHVEAVEIAYGT